MVTVPTLKLVRNQNSRPDAIRQATKRWEASGVLAKDGHFFVVFDDRREIGRFSGDLQANNTNELFGMAHGDCGYEGIAYNAARQRFYLLVEARKQPRGYYQAGSSSTTTNSNISKIDLSTSRSRAATKDLKRSLTCVATARTICWPFAKATSASAAKKAGSPAAGACSFSKRNEKTGFIQVPSRCQALCRLSIIRACLSITVASRSSRR